MCKVYLDALPGARGAELPPVGGLVDGEGGVGGLLELPELPEEDRLSGFVTLSTRSPWTGDGGPPAFATVEKRAVGSSRLPRAAIAAFETTADIFITGRRDDPPARAA